MTNSLVSNHLLSRSVEDCWLAKKMMNGANDAQSRSVSP